MFLVKTMLCSSKPCCVRLRALVDQCYAFRYALLLCCQQSGILLEARLVAPRVLTHHLGRGLCSGIGWLHFHGYLHFTQAYSQQGYVYG